MSVESISPDGFRLVFSGYMRLAINLTAIWLWGLPSRSLSSLVLNREAIKLAEAAALPDVFPDGQSEANQARTSFQRGFRWRDDDFQSASWTPQGLTTSADADVSGYRDGRKWLLVSWFHEDDDDDTDRTRVTFVDITDWGTPIRYRHILLVEPYFDGIRPNFRDVRIHIGGVAWTGRYLFVVDTHYGLRVFDTAQIKEVSTGEPEAIGRLGGSYHAHDYRYILPQIATYRSFHLPVVILRSRSQPLRCRYCLR